jgi:hypothetical protein
VSSSIVTLELDPASDDDLLVQVLRQFDVARRELACRVTGLEGAFVGFSTLEIDKRRMGEASSSNVRVVARLVEVSGRYHRAEYAAVPIDDSLEASARVLVRGSGVTLHVAVPGPRAAALDAPPAPVGVMSA